MTKISASILEVNPLRYYESIKEAVDAGISLIHFDITDGIYSRRISFGDRLVSSVLKSFSVSGEVHLMVSKPEIQVESFLNIEKVEAIYFHPEASSEPLELIKKLKEKGIKAGIALTHPSELNISLLEAADRVLVLLVRPGEGGQKPDMNSIELISELRSFKDKNGLNFTIAADGGIKAENLREIAVAGAEILVIGTGIFSGKIPENVKKIKEALESAKTF